jgi:hypothetical protein
MTVAISTLARNESGDSIVDLLDTGTLNPNGYLEVRTLPTGVVRPTSPQAAVVGTLLAILRLSNPAFGNFNNGQAVANPIAADTNIAETGIAAWFRAYNRDNIAVFDGDVSLIGGSGDIQFDNISFVKGGTAVISALTAIMPQ